MDIYSVPMLISGILFALISCITWLFRRRENINRVFSFFTLAFAIDSLGTFAWFQFGKIEHIHIWIRIFNTAGFLIPIGLILFFFAFTGYDKRMDARVLGIKVRHFQIFSILLFVVCMMLNPFTELLTKIPDTPKDILDIEEGPVGKLLYPLFAGIFFYLLTMVFKSYRTTDNKPQKRFILMLALSTAVWILIGYGAVLFISNTGALYQFISYLGIALMAVFLFVAIVNYQSDKVHEMNLNLERRVKERTRELEENQVKLLQSEKMAALGNLVAGVSHEINNPMGAINSTNSGTSKILEKLLSIISEATSLDELQNDKKFQNYISLMQENNKVSLLAGDKITKIVQTLKNFARLDEAEFQLADIHHGIEDTLVLLHHELKFRIEVKTEFGDIPKIYCYPNQLNQVFMNITMNAIQSIEEKGEIKIRTHSDETHTYIDISDNGRGIPAENLEKIFDPGYTTKSSGVGTGLGLSIVYNIIEAHKGNIKVKSVVNEGSTFTIEIPKTEYKT